MLGGTHKKPNAAYSVNFISVNKEKNSNLELPKM